jgi:hypothetical protein
VTAEAIDARHDGAEDAPCIEAIRTARVSHVCAICDGTIQPGQEYRRLSFPPHDILPTWETIKIHRKVRDCDGLEDRP